MPCRNWTEEEQANIVMKLLAKSTLTAETEFLKKWESLSEKLHFVNVDDHEKEEYLPECIYYL
jgi:hypothetical protein